MPVFFHIAQTESARAATPAALPAIVANDNRVSAGMRVAGIMRISLVAHRGLWYPEGAGSPGVPIAAFGEVGKPLAIPGPLVRVAAGTRVEIRLRNDLPETLHVHGFSASSDDAMPIVLRSGQERTVTFVRNVPGTYGYWASDPTESFASRFRNEAELTGAIVVDDPHDPKPNDRVFVVNTWDNVWKDGAPNFAYELQTFNGLSWPATERLDYVRGSKVRWRVYNASQESHPLHLHGFPFVLDAVGDGRHVISYRGGPQLREVTHDVEPGDTFDVHWLADRAGTWMFHCHIAPHILRNQPLAAMIAGNTSLGYAGAKYVHPVGDSMGGLLLAVRVRPALGDRALARDRPSHSLALDVIERPSEKPVRFATLAYELHDGDAAVSAPGTLGPLIVLQRGQATAITVTNHLSEPTTVHWHGIEVQHSYDDGAGGMGSGRMTAADGSSMKPGAMDDPDSAPSIDPGKTFVAHFTPPRAGTFAYHTHRDDTWQLVGGLAGPLVVMPPGVRFDPTTDHVVMLTVAPDDPFGSHVRIDGELTPEPIVVHASVPQRFRFINMTALNPELAVELDGPSLAVWTPLAKDGVDLDPRLQTPHKAISQITIGETRDFRFVPHDAQTYALDVFDGSSKVGSVAVKVVP